MKKAILLGLALALVLTGCAAPAAETPEPTESVSPVYTDWSKLTPYEAPKALYTRRYEGYTDHVIPADDYGPLVPFAGNVVYNKRGGISYTYGLATLTGEVVTDPVFLSVEYLEDVVGTPLLLTRTFPGEDFPLRSALCAQDGSWCTDFVYGDAAIFTLGLMNGVVGGLGYQRGVPLRKGKTGFALMDPATGEETCTLNWSDVVPWGAAVSWSNIAMDPATWWVTVNCTIVSEGALQGTTIPLLFDGQGSRHPLPESVKSVGQYSEGLIPAQGEKNTWGYIDTAGNWVIQPRYGSAEPFENGVALVCGDRFIDKAGVELARIDYAQRSFHGGGYWFFFNSYQMLVALYDEKGQSVTSSLVGRTVEANYQMGDWLYLDTAEGAVLLRDGEERDYPAERGRLRGFYEERMVFLTDEGVTSLTDWEGNVLKEWDWGVNSYTWLQTDPITGTVYLIRRYWPEHGGAYQNEYYDLEGNLIAAGAGEIRGGLLISGNEFRTLEGERVFYWPIYAGE